MIIIFLVMNAQKQGIMGVRLVLASRMTMFQEKARVACYLFIFIIFRDVAQLVARVLWEHDVAGSNPVIPTKILRL